MKMIFTAALAISLLGGTAAMAQPGDKNRDHGNQGEQADRQADHKAQKAEDKENKRDSRAAAPEQAVGAPRALNTPSERAADSRPQGRDNRNVPTAPSAPQAAAPDRAADARPQGRDGRNGPGTRANQPAAMPSMAPVPAVRDVRGQDTRIPSLPSASVPQYQTRNQEYQNRNQAAVSGGYSRSQSDRWSRGDRLPDQYRQDRYYVNDWQQHGLRQPPGGYRWVRDDNNDFYLSLMSTGVIADTVYRSDRDDRWRRRYSRNYSYNDDVYYQQCRRSPDPAGVLIGGLIGGLLGNAAGSGNRTGATVAGVILGGAVGAALTSNMNCDDRSYAYRTYYNGFNAGRPGNYQWRNPRNDNRGEIRIGGYYNDPYGFRCARFNQVTYIQGRAYQANGVACRQPDGNWAVVS